jgi:glucose-6-phosphate 1-dehydrogenase
MRLIVEKPFGRDRESARLLNETLHRHFPEPSIYRIDHYLGKEPVQNLIYFHLANELVNCSFHGQYVDHVQITMAETLGVEGRGKFYEEVGAIRDVVENHMLQVIACLAMECPASRQVEALRDEKARIIKAMRPLTREDVVRGQYRGYRQEPGVAPDSTIETYAAIRVRIDNDRWDGVPFYVRAGKRLPVGVTEIFVKYRQPLWTKVMEDRAITGNYLRLRLSPDTEIAEGTHVKKAGAQLQGQGLELVASYAPPEEMLPYERLFEDALAGDIELFGREDMIDAQWRVVDKVLNDLPPPYPYEQFTWGPSEASALLLGGATWHDPILEDRAVGAAAQGPAVKGRYPRRSNIRAVHQTEGARPAAVQPH